MIKISIKISVMVVILSMVCLALEKMLGFRDQCFLIQPITDAVLFVIIGFVYSFGFKSFRTINIRNKTEFSKFFLLGTLATIIIALFQPMILWLQEHFLDPDFYQAMINDWSTSSVNIKFIQKQLGTNPTLTQMKMEAQKIYNHSHQLYLSLVKTAITGITYSVGLGYISFRKHFGN